MKSSKKRKPVSEKQRASDDKLRELLRNPDLGKLDKAIRVAVQATAQPSPASKRR
jgi:hypothetical protein